MVGFVGLVGLFCLAVDGGANGFVSCISWWCGHSDVGNRKEICQVAIHMLPADYVSIPSCPKLQCMVHILAAQIILQQYNGCAIRV